MISSTDTVDIAMVGGGIMSMTLATILKELDPNLSIIIYDRLGDVAMESSNPWNNAGTGHSALCELNYSPQAADGSVSPMKALKINETFQVSRQFWSYLVNQGIIADPGEFIQAVPHMSMVFGKNDIEYLKKRFDGVKDHPLFAGLEYTEDPEKIAQWVPITMYHRDRAKPIAVTYTPAGTDVNFGRLTHLLKENLLKQGVAFHLDREVTGLKRKNGVWGVTSRGLGRIRYRELAQNVFVGSGGSSLHLLQKSRIPEIRGFGGFPVSGKFLKTTNPELIAKHQAKVYGKASVGAPPMSVPHLDTRVVDGEKALLFGPFAGFTPKFLKYGSIFDLFTSIRFGNLIPMIASGLGNLGLVKYLVTEVFASKNKRLEALRVYFPAAEQKDWTLITAGQRVQVIKPVKGKGGVLQFGTEVISSPQNGIAGLLGASPGASTAAPIMLQVLADIFPNRMAEWQPKLLEMVPSFGQDLVEDHALAARLLSETAATLKIHD
ncbi:MAG: malate dehydrogenase (quinone) [Microbacteriaceae bacterium]